MYLFRLFDKADTVNPVDARLLRDGALRVGRDPACDWVIPDPDCEISRSHFELRVDGDGLLLHCSGSNGVFDETGDLRFPDNCDIALAPPQSVQFGKFRMVVEHAPDADLAGGGDSHTQVFCPPLGHSIEVPTDWADAGSPTAEFSEGSLFEAFCEGAGLDASLLSGEEPADVMRRAGAVYRQMVLGVGDLMAERERSRAQRRLTRTTIGGRNNNPFKWAPTHRLAIDLLLAGESSFLSGPAALNASFQDIKKHLVASFTGFGASLRAAVETFDPARIEAAVAGRSTILKSRAVLQCEEMRERHSDLTRQLENGEDGSLNQAFIAAYASTSPPPRGNDL